MRKSGSSRKNTRKPSGTVKGKALSSSGHTLDVSSASATTMAPSMDRNQSFGFIGQGPHLGHYFPGQEAGAPYQDPVHVRQWAEMSAASIDSCPGNGADIFPNDEMCLDFTPTVALERAISLVEVSDPDLQTSPMDYTGGLDLSLQCPSSSAHMEYSHNMSSAMAEFQGHELGFSLVQNEGQLEDGLAYTHENYVYPTPVLDDVSFFESAGSHSMCHQNSAQSYLNSSTEWDSPDSSPHLNGIPMAQVTSRSPPMNMALLDETTWPGHDTISNGNNGTFQSIGALEMIPLPPTNYLGDQSTVRPHALPQRAPLPDVNTWNQMQSNVTTQGYNAVRYPLQVSSRRSSEGEPTVTARKDPLYKAKPKKDGLYHCPFEQSENCKHQAEKLKCNYDKHLDSHLKPYRCRYPDCATLKFSSTACLLRHEREAHGLHGHGDKPYPCYFLECDRSAPGQGFPRQWNLRDHMRRVHNYSPPPTSDYPSPPMSSSSGEVDVPSHRKRSPLSALDTGSKKPKTGIPPKPSKKDIASGHADSEREQHMILKAFIDRTYKDLDQGDFAGIERYHADLAKLKTLHESMRRKESHRRAH